jgi:uncharacterized RDD family membrane protein YckC
MNNVPPPLPAMNPYAAPVARVEDAAVGDYVLAGRGTRFLAALVDGLIIMIPVVLISVMVPLMFPPQGGTPSNLQLGLLGGGSIVLVLAVIAVNCVLLHRYGQTMAKRMFNIKIVRGDGSRCSLARIILARWLPVTLVGLIPLLGPILTLIDPLFIFRDDHRCLHDQIADTIVVDA